MVELSLEVTLLEDRLDQPLSRLVHSLGLIEQGPFPFEVIEQECLGSEFLQSCLFKVNSHSVDQSLFSSLGTPEWGDVSSLAADEVEYIKEMRGEFKATSLWSLLTF